ncbi:MAG TPA: bifunctional isocitrate dehydrogenase kinase/phosphatase [Candidatus Eisenbacteria bacterium]|jgi:isocitrate dehydrogenase kinase/phosphatase
MAPDATAQWADRGAAVLLAAFESYRERFSGITACARRHFEQRDWNAAQADSMRRLDVYGECVADALRELGARLGPLTEDRPTWAAMREAYARSVACRDDAELAETFYNSCVRRTFHTVGVDPDIEFVAIKLPDAPGEPGGTFAEAFSREDRLEQLVRRMLERYTFAVPWDDPAGDAARIAEAIVAEAGGRRVRAIEMARSVFFRGKGAYLVGRLLTDGVPLPLLLALRNPSGRVIVDAALLSEDEVSIVFSFARAYFFVESAHPREVVNYLRAIMPRKALSELYTSIGFHRHGKTELYRSLLRHLATSDDRFTIAPGQRGMVMCVFTLPGFDVVFKVIRDRFDPPKTATREEVREKYRLVFRHDRAGRLVDAMEFEHLEFARERFAPELLEQLLELAGETVRVQGETVVIRHLYTERRLRPLDLYLREAEPAAAREAVQDYGQVLRDLAATNIFPGDMLLKNFGVSRHGRLIFYDYDELAPLSECRFREMPRSSADGEDTAGEPWYYVGERDIFPEEFRTFLGLRGELLAVFLDHHEELLGVSFWHRMQAVHRRGEVLDIFPYRASRRLRRGAADPDATLDPTPGQERTT